MQHDVNLATFQSQSSNHASSGAFPNLKSIGFSSIRTEISLLILSLFTVISSWDWDALNMPHI